jgi:polyhydroxybutyrate depolymerase
MPDRSRLAATAAILVCAALAAGCGRRDYPLLAPSGTPPAGTYRGSIEFDGRQRRYLLTVPASAQVGLSLPVVVSYHGGGGDAAGHLAYTRTDTLADDRGFLLVVPDGTGRLDDRLLTWNAGGCCGYAQDQQVDDVGFTLALLDELEGRFRIDRRRVVATGLSNGAMMAYRLAAEAPQAVAAIAPIAGAMLFEPFAPELPVPVLHIHSLDDPRALYDGGLGPPFPLTNRQVEHAPVEAMLARWAESNGCGDSLRVVEQRDSRPDPQGAVHTATLLAYQGCPPGGEVRLWRLTGAGHVWPGGGRNYLESILGQATDVIDANRELWEFFEAFGRIE